MIRQATLLDHGPVAMENTAFTQCETTNMPHRAHLLNSPSWLDCAEPEGHCGVPAGLGPEHLRPILFHVDEPSLLRSQNGKRTLASCLIPVNLL
jgi:hypothetical protein